MSVTVMLPGRNDDDFDHGPMPQPVQAHLLRVGRKLAWEEDMLTSPPYCLWTRTSRNGVACPVAVLSLPCQASV
jgi:hypothetical protein